jgi:hypothetical protein
LLICLVLTTPLRLCQLGPWSPMVLEPHLCHTLRLSHLPLHNLITPCFNQQTRRQLPQGHRTPMTHLRPLEEEAGRRKALVPAQGNGSCECSLRVETERQRQRERGKRERARGKSFMKYLRRTSHAALLCLTTDLITDPIPPPQELSED